MSGAAIVAFAGFIANVRFLPRTVDRGPASSIGSALAVDAMLVALFAFQHSAMAREAGQRFGRALYLIASGIVLLLLAGRWHPIPTVIWHVGPSLGRAVVHVVFVAGWIVLVVSTLELGPLEFAGLRRSDSPTLRIAGLHRVVRHPTYLGWLVVLWAAPTMTAGRALLAGLLTAYILVAIQLEERDLARIHGEAYERYRRTVPMLLPGVRSPQRP